jgi:hypothetical protein
MKGVSGGPLKGFGVLAAILASAAASAAPATFDFMGTVTASDVASVAAGTKITGTYTIDLSNADPNSSDGPINPIFPWIRAVVGGAAYSQPVPAGTVFSSTAKAGSFNFADSAPSALGSASQVTGGSFFYGAYDSEYISRSSFEESTLSINDFTAAPFTAGGLPVLGANSVGTGSIFYAVNVSDSNGVKFDYGPKLDYSITSLTPVHTAPEMDPASAVGGITLLLGAIAVIRGRRRVIAAR